MSAQTVRISDSAHKMMKELAQATGASMTDLLDKALAAYKRKLFFEQLNAGYAELRSDPKAWAEHEAERKLWDVTLMDGLDPDEDWTGYGPDDGGVPKNGTSNSEPTLTDKWGNSLGTEAARINELLSSRKAQTARELHEQLVAEFPSITPGRIQSHINSYLERKHKRHLRKQRKGRQVCYRLV